MPVFLLFILCPGAAGGATALLDRPLPDRRHLRTSLDHSREKET
jgi:hypothetical protein